MLHPQSELQAATTGEEEEEDAASAADAQMQGVNRAFATAKRAGVPAATRLMKELRRVCMNGSYEVSVNEDAPQPLLCWAVRLYEFNFDEDSPLAEDLAELSSRSGSDEPRSVAKVSSWWCHSLLPHRLECRALGGWVALCTPEDPRTCIGSTCRLLPPAANICHLSVSRPTPLCLCLKYPADFPFSPPLVYVSTPQLLSNHVLDGGAKP